MFSSKFCEILRTHFLENTSGRLLLSGTRALYMLSFFIRCFKQWNNLQIRWWVGLFWFFLLNYHYASQSNICICVVFIRIYIVFIQICISVMQVLSKNSFRYDFNPSRPAHLRKLYENENLLKFSLFVPGRAKFRTCPRFLKDHKFRSSRS